MSVKSVAAAAILSAAITAVVFYSLNDRQVQRLKAHADSVAVQADSAKARVTVYGDSLRRLSDSAAVAESRAKAARSVASHAVQSRDSAVAHAKTAADSIPALVAEVSDLKQENLDLQEALSASDAQIAMERLRGDSLFNTVRALHKNVLDLQEQIDRLHVHSLPSWARTALKIGEGALAVRGAVSVVTGR